MERMDRSHERIMGLRKDLCSDNSSCNYKGKGLFRGWFAKVNDQNANFSHSEKDVTNKQAINGYYRYLMWPRFLLMNGHHT